MASPCPTAKRPERYPSLRDRATEPPSTARGEPLVSAKTLAIANEAISEAAYQLATSQEAENPEGVAVALAILQAIANAGGKEAKATIKEELATYWIPFCALEIGSSEEGERE